MPIQEKILQIIPAGDWLFKWVDSKDNVPRVSPALAIALVAEIDSDGDEVGRYVKLIDEEGSTFECADNEGIVHRSEAQFWLNT